ncbi:FAD-dependent oxidoreductase [Maribellus mangrovi]|uniref:FAD-dependent oxidoreductase n=1 Tax=Maribellus mangrovi TaxID=3133146 RepID=UPI0030EDF698
MILIQRQIVISLLLALILCSGCSPEKQKNTLQADVIIYGGTSAAVMAAVQCVRLNKSVIIVCPEKHLGGMTSSGLGFTDTGNKEVIGGLAREFYQRVYSHYQKEDAWKWQTNAQYGNKGQGTLAIDGNQRTMWIFEPHVAEQIFEDFVAENNITGYLNKWLDRENGVVLENNKIISIRTLDGMIFSAQMFIDATYEGDLMAAAGVSYAVGRESNKTYNEEWNGVQTDVLHHGHHFGNLQISPFMIPGDPDSGILPRISTEPPGEKGQADQKVQAYCYRMCLTKVAENQIPFERPIDYDSTQYELLVRLLNKGWNETFNKFDPIPNLKTDVNNHGPFSFDNIGMNYDYPEASYERRTGILKEHQAYQKGLLYFYASDPRVPSGIQEEMQKWGLAKDEFSDNGNWPYQIYVREARRMVGDFVMTEHEILGNKSVPNSIGMGSYTMDSHNVQRYITSEGFVQNEGDIGVHPHQPYQIAMGSILPKETECTNLLVPVAISSSHIAYGSIRMEPVFMILGQSAAVMAGMAINNEINLQKLDYELLRKELEAAGQVLEYHSF